MIKHLVCAAAILFAGPAAQAYGPTGHRVVAEIASKHLSPAAEAAMAELLGPEFMAEAANWPDEMKSDPDEYWRRTSQTYHYINLPAGARYEDSPKNPAGDALTALEAFTATLKDTAAPKGERVKALRFIIHIVGDLHQPLHAGHAEDRGGNSVKVVWFEEMSNLHKVWDEDLINRTLLSFTEWTRFLDAKITPDQVNGWQNSVPLDWVHEDIELRDDIYNVGSGILSYDYVYKYMPLVKSQLSKGGVRLAGYLNGIFSAE